MSQPTSARSLSGPEGGQPPRCLTGNLSAHLPAHFLQSCQSGSTERSSAASSSAPARTATLRCLSHMLGRPASPHMRTGPSSRPSSTPQAARSAQTGRPPAARRSRPCVSGALRHPAGRWQVGHSRSALHAAAGQARRRAGARPRTNGRGTNHSRPTTRCAICPPAICPPTCHLPTHPLPLCRPGHSRATLAGQGNSVPGLRAVRGTAALHESGVEVVAQWRQSNWPALVRRSDVRVRHRRAALTMTLALVLRPSLALSLSPSLSLSL